ncbi:MAG TPA: response regulator [Planctomycetaceae bacterium]|nr:response regulator [Planctomycetaceae bacterium]
MTRVLIVDDSLTDRRLAGGLITRSGDLDVHFAVDGRDALEQIELHLPDVVITDLNMPEIDGLALVKSIREQYPMVPVILMTAQGSDAIAVEALKSGAASYVPKRRLADDLVSTVQQVLTIAHADRGRSRLMRRLQREQIEFRLENDLELIMSLVQFLQDAVRGMRLCDDADRIRLGVALQEAMINACFHGNLEVSSSLRETDHHKYYDLAKERAALPPYSERRITVSMSLSAEEAVFIIADEGPGFDPHALPDPRAPHNLEKPSGRGLLLMQTFMDEVRYNSRGNEVTMVKRRSPPQPCIESPMINPQFFRCQQEGSVLVVQVLRPVGSLAEQDVMRDLDQILIATENSPSCKVLIDFNQAAYFGSSLLEALRIIWTKIEHREGRMMLCNLAPVGKEIVQIAKFDQLWPVCETKAEALELME